MYGCIPLRLIDLVIVDRAGTLAPRPHPQTKRIRYEEFKAAQVSVPDNDRLEYSENGRFVVEQEEEEEKEYGPDFLLK